MIDIEASLSLQLGIFSRVVGSGYILQQKYSKQYILYTARESSYSSCLHPPYYWPPTYSLSAHYYLTKMNLLHALLLPLTLALTWLYTLTTRTPPPRNKRITLLIAHPDDEAMFFAPTLLTLTKPPLNNTLSVLCLSTGNADGIGHIRKSELVDSCARLGVPTDRVTSLDHPDLQDNQHAPWPPSTIAHALRTFHLDAPDILITFDAHGVSGHANHVSCLRGAQEWLPAGAELWTLTTVPLWRKYLFVFDGAVQAALGAGRGMGMGMGRTWWFVSTAGEVRVAREAMVSAHKSQMRWFRWGWIGVSRYMVVNGLERAM